MKFSNHAHLDPKWGIVVFAMVFFAFFQLITGLVETTYAFGLLGVDIPPETLFVLFLLTPLLLLAYPSILEGKAGQIFTLVTCWLALICWALSLALDTRGKLIVCGLGAGAGLLALAGLVRRSRADAYRLPFGEILAVAALISIALRANNDGNDFFMNADLQKTLLVGIWVVFIMINIWRWVFSNQESETIPIIERPGIGRMIGLCLGLFSILALVYFAFGSPAVIARWTDQDYTWITVLTAVPLALLLVAWPNLPLLRPLLAPSTLQAWNLLFAVSLTLTLGAYGLRFPSYGSGFPIHQPEPGPAGQTALIIMLLLHPVIYLDFGVLVKTLVEGLPSPRALVGGFSLGAVYLVLLIFAQIFTTIYDYVPGVGPLFRDGFVLVTAFPAIVLVLAMALLHWGKYFTLPAHRPWGAYFYLGMLAAIVIFIFGLQTVQFKPALDKYNLRILTYNIQQGYDADGQKSFPTLLATIRDQKPDIIGLQESDTARIAGGNSDVVRYLADHLQMYSYYGPRTTTGTFGIALLSRYPIQNPQTFFMFSRGEQTASIMANVEVSGKNFTVLVTHLGNDGPIVQQQQVLRELSGLTNIVAMGDFNFRPDSAQYRLTTSTLQDGWLAAAAKEIPEGEDVATRIDHIFLSPGIQVRSAAYLPPGPSDHPAILLEISW